jgi:diacylglycerol kinase (ATP)
MSAATGKTEPGAPPSGKPAPPQPPVRRFRHDSMLPAQGSLRWSFTWAFAGIVYAIRTQRNMQLHIAAVAIVLILGLALNLSRLEFVAVIAAISLVLVAEMFNTAIEAAVDAVVTDYHPLIKVAKDVAAGAVLIAAVNAVATAYLVFYSHISDPHHELSTSLHAAPTLLVAGAVLLTIVVVLVIKAATGQGTPLRGGLPSGHAAVAFAGWTAITIIADPFAHAGLVSMLAFLMALLVAQSRVEAGIHSAVEVMAGALIGTGLTIVVFQLWG